MKFKIIQQDNNFIVIEKLGSYTFILKNNLKSKSEAIDWINNYEKENNKKLNERGINFWSNLKKIKDL